MVIKTNGLFKKNITFSIKAGKESKWKTPHSQNYTEK